MKTKLTFVIAALIIITTTVLQQANAQWQFSGANIYNTNTGNVGIKTSTPGFPLSFSDALGDKIALWGSSGAHYGFSIQSYLLQIHTDAYNSDIAFGYGSSGAFTERMRIKGNGNVGIGTNRPGFPLSFSDALGDKISLWGSSGSHYGFSIQDRRLQIHTDGYNSDIVFGYGSSAAFTESMRIKGNGNVGIGTNRPGFPLSFSDALGDKISLWGSIGAHYGFSIQDRRLQIHTDGYNSDIVFGYGASAAFTESLRIKGNGNVGIGTLSPAYKLSVNGTIQAKEIKVESGWADYVFEKDYKLLPLEKLASYIEANKHLPDINSAKDIQQNGLAVADMQTKMMAKIEELTLYVIQLANQNKDLQKEIDLFKK